MTINSRISSSLCGAGDVATIHRYSAASNSCGSGYAGGDGGPGPFAVEATDPSRQTIPIAELNPADAGTAFWADSSRRVECFSDEVFRLGAEEAYRGVCLRRV